MKRLVKAGAPQRLGTLKEEGPPTRAGSSISGARSEDRPASQENGSARTPAAPGVSAPPRRRFLPKVPVAKPKQESGAQGQTTVSNSNNNDELEAAARAQAERLARRMDQRGRARPADMPRMSHGSVSVLGPSAPASARSGTGSAPGGSRGPSGGGGATSSSMRQLHDARVKAEQHAAHGMEIEPGMASPSESEDDGPPFDMNAFYPTVLPLQHPDTATIDEVDASADTAVELRATTPEEEVSDGRTAGKLKLWPNDDDHGGQRLMLMQLPALLPKLQPPPKPPHHGSASSAATARKAAASSLQQLGNGQVGKLLIFESGAVKMRVGDVLLDVAAGSACECRQEVALISPASSSVTMLGHVQETAICTPNLEQLLGDSVIPLWQRTDHFQRPGRPPSHSEPVLQIKNEAKAEPMDLDD